MPSSAWINLAPGKGEPNWMSLAREFGNCRRTFILHVPSWEKYASAQNLTWKKVPYKSTKVPEDTRGVYAFVLNAKNHLPTTLPPLSYVLYVGETGDDGSATLRSRLAGYRNRKAQRDRARVYSMLDQWGDWLVFYYALVTTGVSTKACESSLLDALLPPVNNKDFSALVSNARKHVLQ